MFDTKRDPGVDLEAIENRSKGRDSDEDVEFGHDERLPKADVMRSNKCVGEQSPDILMRGSWDKLSNVQVVS